MSSTRKKQAGNSLRQTGGFARRLLLEWKRLALPVTDACVLVAVSGGADSTALLLAIDELLKTERFALKVIVGHLDHGLRGEEGAADARHVEALACAFGFEFAQERVNVRERAADARDNLEQAARRARYEFLSAVASEWKARVVLTAHTLDDQAETVLLRLMRGSGAEGLSGIEPLRAFDVEKSKVRSPKSKVQSPKSKVRSPKSEVQSPKSEVQSEPARLFDAESVGLPDAERGVLLARPLVSWARRSETENYCRERGAEFREDSMNVDERFSRVRVRRQLLPLMREFNPQIVETLARTSELLRDDTSALRALAEELLEKAGEDAAKESLQAGDSIAPRDDSIRDLSLSVKVLKAAPQAVRSRALRLWIERGRGHLRRLELVHLRGVEALLLGERGGRVALLPGGAKVRRKRGRIFFHGDEVEKEDA